tara:strand:+ start:202 stop:642 length:441 start_codon:yes stop_codon:yes gene_type:complete
MATTKIVITPKNARDLTEEERAQVKKRTPLGLSRAALKGINIIQDGLDKGQGFEGTLAPYSDAYALIKRAKKGSSDVVNLKWSGNMRGSITHKYDNDSATIFFSRATEAKKGAMLNKKRPFFGINEKGERMLAKVFEAYVFKGFSK